MSDTSPWGTPPPGGPGPPPTYPQQQGGYQPAHGGPPRRLRTGVVVGTLAAAALVVAAFVVTLVVASDNDAGTEPTGAGATSAAPPSSGTPETSTASPATGDLVSGDGYSFRLPGVGWQDALDETEGLDPGGTIDAFVILGSSVALAQSNILVEALSAGPASDVEDLEDLWKRNLASTDDATPVDIDDTSVAGERAIGVEISDRTNDAGTAIVQVAYLVLHEGNQYSIALTYPAAGDAVSRADFEKVLASWEWTS